MKKQILSLISILLIGFSIGLAQTLTDESKTISGGILNGKASNLAIPAYPAAAKALNAGGAVNVKVVIDENGDVISAEAVSGHPLLRQSAETAARESKFSPTLLSGQPVRVSGIIVYNFTPSNSADSAQTPTEKLTIINGGVINSKAINLVKPSYPPAAMAVRASGSVNVQVTIDEEGNVISANAVSGHPLLRETSVISALQSKFKPTTLAGQSIKVTGLIIYNFIPPSQIQWSEIGGALGFAKMNNGTIRVSLDEFIEALPGDFEYERAQIAELKANKRSGIEIINNVSNSIKNKLSAEQSWFFKLGESLGEFAKILAINGQNFDESLFINKLIQLKDFKQNAPQGISTQYLAELERASNFATRSDLKSPEFLIEARNTLRGLSYSIVQEERTLFQKK